jgi:hypothetical protein
LALDAITGERVAELWDGPGSSLQAVAFVPRPGDLRLLAATNRSGMRHPVIWNPYTDERQELPVEELVGDLLPLDWSPDGEQLLLWHFHRAVQQLYLYHLTDQILTKLIHPAGTLGDFPGRGAYFGSASEIFVHWQDATHPPQIRTASPARTRFF